MSQKIKKQIRRSIPYFMIFSMIFSTTVAGLVFNLDFKIVSTVNKHFGIELGLSQANAQDTAITQVIVKNAPPIIVGNVAEVPVSASNTPVNVGASATWQATANDPELNRFYLIVCGTSAATAHNSAAPTCDAGAGDTFCVSGDTASGGQATCVDNALADPGAESDAWFGFICDNHATEAACSAVNVGSGDSGSPIYINHAPTFSSVLTTGDFKDPGGTFTVTATSTDLDIEGGYDQLYLTVCSTNGWATSTGCTAATWCTGTSTATAIAVAITCSFATSTPAVDNTYATGYYAFVRDWHQMPPGVNGRVGSYTVNNVAPTVSNVVINGGKIINVNMKNSADAVASSSADLYDANSCLDIVNATSSLYLSSVTGAHNCSANANNCYQLTTSECHYVAGSCTGSSDTTASYICSTTISHFAIPTDGSTGNPRVGDNWLAGITAIDNNGLKGSATSSPGVELISLEALAVNELQIPYGSIRGGQNSDNNNATTTIVNYGNVPMSTSVEGSSMIKSDLTDVIVESNQKFDLANFTYGAGTYSLSSTTPANVSTLTPKPTSLVDISDQIFWGIGIPGGTTSGNYAGVNTFTAVINGGGAWQ